MHKAGGWIALIAGFFSIAASFFAGAVGILPGVDSSGAWMYLFGGLLMSAVVIILSIIILNTRSRLPAVLLIALSVLSISQNWGSGFVTICLVFAILGGLFATIWHGV